MSQKLVYCSECQRTVPKKCAGQWVGHHAEGDGHWECIPCIESKMRASKFVIKHGYHPSSYTGLMGPKQGKISTVALFRRKDRALWVKKNKELGIGKRSRKTPDVSETLNTVKILSRVARDVTKNSNFPTGNGLSD